MNKPVLVIMAAGIGSRYGGLKQIDPLSANGETILDFSLYDAMLAGFEEAVFIIKEENEKDFRALIDHRAGKYLQTKYAFQKLEDLPAGYSAPAGRVKPWGTCHAVLSAKKLISGPFAVINADDYYGFGPFQSLYGYLSEAGDQDKYRYAMAGYQVENTLTENGYVSRGVCGVSDEGTLIGITERPRVMGKNGCAMFSEDGGKTWKPLERGTIVSMNFWGFTESFIREAEARFPAFLDKALKENPLNSEYFLPDVVDQLIKEGKAAVKVLKARDKWYGVTYKEDKGGVTEALQAMKDRGFYPDKLWG